MKSLEGPLDLGPADDRRSGILAAAFEQFMRYGYSRVTMDDIARAASLSRPLLYREFRNKADIYAAIATNMLSRTAEAAADVLRGPGGIDERLAGALRAGILEPMTVIMQSPHGAEILDMKGELIADIYTGWRADMLDALTRAIEAEAQTAGADLKSKGLSAAGLAETLLDGIEGVKLRSTDPAEWQRGADRLVALAMLALR